MLQSCSDKMRVHEIEMDIWKINNRTSVSPSQMTHGHLPCLSIEHHSHNGVHKVHEPSSLLTSPLLQTSRFHFSSSIQHNPIPIEILTPPHSYCTDLTYGSQMCPALSERKIWIFSRSQPSQRQKEHY